MVPWPMFARQLSFLKYTNCVQSGRKLLSHCWAGGGWHLGRLSQERISNQAAGGSEPCARASRQPSVEGAWQHGPPSPLRSRQEVAGGAAPAAGRGEHLPAPGTVTATSVCCPEVETEGLGSTLTLEKQARGGPGPRRTQALKGGWADVLASRHQPSGLGQEAI